MPKARFSVGDNPAWRQPDFDDSGWKEIATDEVYEKQGFKDHNGFSWYRLRVVIPSALKDTVFWKKRLLLYLTHIDDVDESFLNGVKIGQTGRFPHEPGGYDTKWQAPREYKIAADNPAILWDQENIIAIRVYDGAGGGGLYQGAPYLAMLEITDGFRLETGETQYEFRPGHKINIATPFSNQFDETIIGVLTQTVFDAANGKVLLTKREAVSLPPNGKGLVKLTSPHKPGIEIRSAFTESTSRKSVAFTQIAPYILTPPASPKPRINGAKVFGVRPGSPFLWKIPATGRAPLTYSAANLPAGLELDAATGIIRGTLKNEGEYVVRLTVGNILGQATRNFTIKAGALLALTPPMGWNSWNAWGLSVTDARVRSSATALIEKGLIDHGWSYVNIDDGWEADKRAANGEIVTNQKFPDMKGLGEFLHARGLKFGIYSSPGPQTCGKFLGSYQHEAQDAASYAAWGIDYLKYDLCSYQVLISKENTLAEHQKPYQLMGDVLQAQPRDIVYSLCQYGERNVWEWGADVNGNLWRTTGDIEDTWASLSGIGFAQDKSAPYARPGRWNDPDMLVVGKVGWSDKLHPTRLTPHEQYTHISLWSLLSAPLLLGCDLASLDDFTLNLLTNDEVIAIDQDPLGQAARQIIRHHDWQVWVKELEDGSKAVGVFNLSANYQTIKFNWHEIGLTRTQTARDVWRQKDLGAFAETFTTRIPPHGVTLITVTAK